jgi:hypothetical protein
MDPRSLLVRGARLRFGSFFVATALVFASGCSPAGGDLDGTSGGVRGQGAGSSSGGSTGHGAITGAGADGFIIDDPSGGSGALGGGETCEEMVTEGERLPLDMFFVFDVSGSMNRSVDGGTRWTVVRQALVDFLGSPESAGIGSGITYFPQVIPGAPTACTENSQCISGGEDYGPCVGGFLGICDFFGVAICSCEKSDVCYVDAYSTPAVPITLPADSGPVVNSLMTRADPNGGTPLRPALEGGHAYAASWAASNPGRKTALVLVGDGEPVGCSNNSIGAAETAAQGALNGPNQIPTYVIGIGPSLENLNRIAAAGGTEQAYLMDDSEAAVKFAEAMDDIRGRAIPCDFVIGDDESIDRTKVNVNYVPRGSTEQEEVLQTFEGRPENCTAEGGWYYSPTNDMQVVMCPATCDRLGGGGRLSVAVGCETRQAPPPR